jgi:two-component system phosphate regulon response regulator PhoB
VLVVEDHPANLELVTRLLEMRDFEVTGVRDGTSALRAVEERRPDVILLDVMMPGMSGIEVLERLKADARFAAIPVILVTAKSSSEDVLAGYSVGADYYIPKPFTADELFYGIALVLGPEDGPPARDRHPASEKGV